MLKPSTWGDGAGRLQVQRQPGLNRKTLSSKANKQNVADLTHTAMRQLKNIFSCLLTIQLNIGESVSI